METERRNHIRFLVEDNVIVALKNRITRIGKVRDISRGGLSFEHIHEEDSEGEVPPKDISFWANEFLISKVPCKVVYDIPAPIPDDFKSLLIRLETRRCGIQFEPLSEDDTARLDLFLKTHTKPNTL